MEQHILIPVDTSQGSDKAFEYVLEELPRPRITLLHVLNPLTVFNYVSGESFDYERARQAEQERRETVERIFTDYRGKDAARNRDIQTVIRSGDPADMILEYTEDSDVDHIVLGSRGRSGLEQTVLGSVARDVAKRSSVPVTIVP